MSTSAVIGQSITTRLTALFFVSLGFDFAVTCLAHWGTFVR